MDLLKVKVAKFIAIDQSIRFRDAQKLVQEQSTLLNRIKSEMKTLGIREFMIEKEDTLKILRFDMKEKTAVDLVAFPDEVKAQYEKTIEVWYKTVLVTKNT